LRRLRPAATLRHLSTGELDLALTPDVRPALRIGAIYLAASVLWIVLSDGVLYQLGLSTQGTQAYQTLKGILFVSLSAGLVTFLAHRELRGARKERELVSELDQSRERYRELFDRNPLPLFAIDRESLDFLAVNDAAVDFYGWGRDELLGMKVTQILPDGAGPLVRGLLADPPSGRGRRMKKVRQQGRDGSELWVDLTTHWMRFMDREAELVVVHDRTAQLRAERQLRQAQRLESVGRLAAGVAHDFNNVLSVVGGVAELARLDAEDGGELATMMDEILEAQARGAALARQLLAFGGENDEQPEPTDLCAALDGLGQILRRLVGSRVQVGVTHPDRPVVVLIPPIHLEQVLMNLAVNARDAMDGVGSFQVQLHHEMRPEGPGPNLPSPILQVDSPVEGAVPTRPSRAGWAVLIVSDTGCGMTPEVADAAFDPFFTTKGTRGTGLGLSTLYRIVTAAGGTVGLASTPGEGTTFTIRLPVMEEGAA